MLLRGTVSLVGISNLTSVGTAVYMHTTAGEVSQTAPSGNNNIVRIVGYALTNNNSGAGADLLWFNPDSTFVKITA